MFCNRCVSFLALNILYTTINIILLLLLCNIDIRIILKYITMPYTGIYLIVVDVTKLILRMKKIYTRWAELYKRIHKTKISDIVMMQVDSKYTRLIEKIREE